MVDEQDQEQDQEQVTETVEDLQTQTKTTYVLIALILAGAFVWDKYRGKY